MPAEQPLTIVLDVSPRLLLGALARALEEHTPGLVITPIDEADPEGAFDVAVTSASLPEGMCAHLVLHIAAQGDPGDADRPGEARRVRNLDDVRQAIHELTGTAP